jgi:hypothetical protein
LGTHPQLIQAIVAYVFRLFQASRSS